MNWKDIIYGLGSENVEDQLQYLLNTGSQITSRTDTGKTALHVAARLGNVTVAKFLLKHGADIDAIREWTSLEVFQNRPEKPSWWFTPLHYGTQSGNGEMVQLLIDSGCKINATSKLGDSALDVAFRLRCERTLWVLIHNGAKCASGKYLPTKVGGLPPWACEKIEQTREPKPLIRHLEHFLRKDAAKLEIFSSEGDENYCKACIGRISETRKNAVIEWRGPDTTFNYGFLKRCQLCMASISKLPDTIELSGRVWQGAPESTKSRMYEEDLEYLFVSSRELRDDSTASHCAFRFAAYWLLRCLKSHRNCDGLRGESASLPTRVIDVGELESSQSPVLYETKEGEKGLYCALSYRWITNNITTTKQRLSDFKASLPYSQLAPAIQHAITITKQLGIRYLWVDSICIVQDDESDWKTEVLKMHTVYRNSILTIASINSQTRRTGIFQLRQGQSVRDKPSRRPRGVLDTRGWTLQEQLLSPRVLSYARGQLFWNCEHLSASESCPSGIPAILGEDRRDEDIRLSRSWLNGALADSNEMREKAYSLWRRLVKEYSQRELTQGTDKAAAITGIALAFGERLDDKLIAGIWRQRFIEHLAWWVKPQKGLHAKPDLLLFPTWSWLSMGWPVSYEIIAPYEVQQSGGFLPCAKIENVVMNEDVILEESLGSFWVTGSLMEVEAHEGPFGLRNCLSPAGYRERREQYRINREEALRLPYYMREDDQPEDPYCAAPLPNNRGYEPWYPDDMVKLWDGKKNIVNSWDGEKKLYCFHLGNAGGGRLQYTLVLSKIGRRQFRRVGICAWNIYNVDVRWRHGESQAVIKGVASHDTIEIV